MADKKKRKISEKQNIKNKGHDQTRGRTRVNIEAAFQRWRELKEWEELFTIEYNFTIGRISDNSVCSANYSQTHTRSEGNNARSRCYCGLEVLPEHTVINKDDLLNILLLWNFYIYLLVAYLKVKPTCCAFYNEFISYSQQNPSKQ